jgi:hypothetical protein
MPPILPGRARSAIEVFPYARTGRSRVVYGAFSSRTTSLFALSTHWPP